MKNVTTMGIDLAKNYIQIHGADVKGKAVLKKRIARANFLSYMANIPKCLIGMEACGGAHYWARELIKLGFEVKLMSPRKVKKYVENNKNDANDAAACCEAVERANMTFVPIKQDWQLEIQAIHRVRSQFIKQRTGLMNMIRGLLLEMGIAIRKGRSALCKASSSLLTENTELSWQKQSLFKALFEHLNRLDQEIAHYTKQLENMGKENALCRRLQTISGIAAITATALVAKIGNGSEFQNGRELSAYLGLVPKQCSSGEKQMLLGISKHGDRYLRQLLIHGGRSCIQAAMRADKITGLVHKQDPHSEWVRKLKDRVGMNKASVAIANKNARIVVALLKNGTSFDPELAHRKGASVVDFVNAVDNSCPPISHHTSKGEAVIHSIHKGPQPIISFVAL
jgi:transposase